MKETKRLQEIPLAGIRKVFEKAKKLEAQGKKIIHLEIGRPDFDTPAPIKAEAIQALKDGFVHYTSNYGMDELREVVAEKLRQENNLDYGAAEVIITAGASMGIAAAILGLVEVGDEVLIPAPAYPAYRKQVKLAGATPIEVPLELLDDFRINIEELERKYSQNTKMLIINTPHNPTGTLLDSENLKEIAEFVRSRDIMVLSDECYENITFGNNTHHSIAEFPGMKENSVVVNSTSKSFSMTGWRIGFLASSQAVIDSVIKVPQNISICPTSFAQSGAIKAYREGKQLIRGMLEVFAKRKEIVVNTLERIPDFGYVEPGGALYVFPEVTKTGLSSQEFSDYLLEEAGIAVTPGDDFGEAGRGFIRIAFTCCTEDLKEAMVKLEEAVRILN